MKKMKAFLTLSIVAGALLLSSFAPGQPQHMKIVNYAWYTPAGQFVAWSTLANAEIVSGDDLNPANGTLDLEGYTSGGPGQPPSGTLVYKLYSHP